MSLGCSNMYLKHISECYTKKVNHFFHISPQEIKNNKYYKNFLGEIEMKKVNKQCLLDTPHSKSQ